MAALLPWAQVAVFVSEGNYDGYVTASNGTRTAVPNAAQPGIQAGFDALGPCMVDIRKGRFNSDAALEEADIAAVETGVDTGNWVEAELHPNYISDINTTDRTQFRLWFPHVQGAREQLVGWYSGESTGNEPHLVVQYTGP